MHRIPTLLAAILFAVLVVPAGAGADMVPMDVAACEGASEGDPCRSSLDTEGKDGTCQKATCSRLDYSDEPPKTVSYECLKCREGAVPGTVVTGAVVTAGSIALGLLLIAFSKRFMSSRRDGDDH